MCRNCADVNRRFAPFRRSDVWPWLPVVVWMGLIFYLSAQPHSQLPGVAEPSLDGWIKHGGHAFGYAVLAFLWWRIAHRGLWSGAAALAIAFALTMLYALSDEVHQGFVPEREFSAIDVVIDAAGAVTALGCVVWMRRGSPPTG